MSADRDKILAEVSAKRDDQDKKWGTAFDDKNTANDWSAYITRYNGNASFAPGATTWRKNMVDVAALAVAALEAFDRNNGLPKRHYD